MAPFWVFLGSYFPKYCSMLQKFSLIRQTHCLKNLSKFCILAQMRCTQKFTVLVYFGTDFTARKTKILLKTTIFAKTTFLEISNNVSQRSQKNQRVLVPLSRKKKQKKLSGGEGAGGGGGERRLGVNCLISNSHTVYNRTIHLYILNARFQLLGICHFRLDREEASTFFWSRTKFGPLFGGWGWREITPINNVRLS